MATVNLFGDLALDDTVKETNNKLTALTATRDLAMSPTQKGIVAFGVRQNEDIAAASDGSLLALAVDEEGRLKTSNKTGSFTPVTGTLATTASAPIAVDVRRASNVVLHFKNTGTVAMASGTFTFEGSLDSTDGVNGTWFGIQAVRSNANIIETTTAVLTPAIAVGKGALCSWEASVNAYQYMRVKCQVNLTAGAVASWTVLRGSYATEPIPAAQASPTQPVSGTVTVASTVANLGTITTGTSYVLATTAAVNSAVIKATAGNVYEISVSNPTATPAYVKLYAKATAPTVGTDVPVLTIPIAAGGPGAGFETYSFGTTG